MSTETPRIYVADLAAYNAGTLHGVWIDADQDMEGIQHEIREMLSSSPVPDAEEIAVHDYEGFGTIRFDEYTGLSTFLSLAAVIREYGRLACELYNQYCDDVDDVKTALENYTGLYKSAADFAREITEETREIPAEISYYIDYDKMARDMEMAGDIDTMETGFEEVHIFWSR